MARLFGTDGIRGIANTELSCVLAMDVAKATATVMEEELGSDPTVLVGIDTRVSGPMLVAAMNAGFSSVGANSVNIGVVPTPVIAYLVTYEHADMGVMISASHNPYDYNGIKIFGPQGFKLTDEQEFSIEKIVLDRVKPYPITWGEEIGRISSGEEMVGHYITHLVESVGGTDLTGMRVALDCSNGSASFTARELFEQLGVETTILNDKPDGFNINRDCGSTHMEQLVALVKAGEFDAGFAFDGDADRCLAVDETGEIVDGDVILAVMAMDLRARGLLKENTLVATVMSNLGLTVFAKEQGFALKTTKVGDRYVLEQMLKDGFVLGGEQSGHVIFSEYMSTGDGQLTAIQLLGALKRSGKKLSELAGVMTVYPQVMRNIRADATMKSALAVDEGAQKIITVAQRQLGGSGRILVRPSGTEPLIRVMIEGKNQEEIELLVEQVAEDLTERLQLNQSLKSDGER